MKIIGKIHPARDPEAEYFITTDQLGDVFLSTGTLNSNMPLDFRSKGLSKKEILKRAKEVVDSREFKAGSI